MAENFNESLGIRLKKTREKLGLKLQDVAKQMGFNNYQILSNIENGSREIKAAELTQLAHIYLRDITYFLNPNRKEEPELAVMWRNRPAEDDYKLSQEKFLTYCEKYYLLEEMLNIDHRFSLRQLSNLTPDDFSYEKIKEMASDYYNEMQLGSRPACVLKKILEEKYNIKILYLNLGAFGSAASAIGKFGAAILINSSEAPWRRNYDLAHELFHIITWNVFNYSNIHEIAIEKPLIEKWADSFASNLLLPAEEVRRECENKVKDDTISLLDIIGIAREFVVSTEALLWRLVNLKCINKDAAERLIKSLQDNALDKRDQKEKLPHVSMRYMNLAFKAYQLSLISKGKLAEYLDVNRNDIGSMLHRYGYSEEGEYNARLAVA
jgi:Zn-dependent peptidase ImmA (M78 family)/DNA-binding XRE family transcriptional regulator